MAEVFPPPGIDLGMPDWGLRESPDREVNIVKLGDGYEFREPVGLNSIRTSLQPVWSNLDPEVAQEAYDALRPKLMITSVLWTHPVTNRVLKVIPDGLGIEWDTHGNAVLSVTWREDFNPG